MTKVKNAEIRSQNSEYNSSRFFYSFLLTPGFCLLSSHLFLDYLIQKKAPRIFLGALMTFSEYN